LKLEAIRNHCLSLKGAMEEFPFGENTPVYKVMGKMFALASEGEFTSMNLKVDPETGVELREKYPSVQAGYHMNKKHWITVLSDGSIPDKLMRKWIEDSYQLVVDKLPKSQRVKLDAF